MPTNYVEISIDTLKERKCERCDKLFWFDLLTKCKMGKMGIFRFEIPMMVGRFKIPVGYSSDLECRIAELPFSSRRVSFFIILPDDVDRGITKLEANMTSDNIKALFSTLKVRSAPPLT